MRAGRINDMEHGTRCAGNEKTNSYWDTKLTVWCGINTYLPSIQFNSSDEEVEEVAEGRRRGMQRRNRGLNFAVRVRGGAKSDPGEGILL